MGILGAPLYGKDLGSAIETAEKILAKIKTNRYDRTDLAELAKALNEINVAVSDESED